MPTHIYFHSCFIFALVFSLPLTAQQPGPVESEPLHHVLLKNESVAVIRLTLKPGEATQYHTHSHDRVIVHLSDSSIIQQTFGEVEGAPQQTKTGEVLAPQLDSPYAHRVRNVGTGMFDVMDIEFLHRSREPESKAIAPVAVENRSARVYKWMLAPGTTSSMHTHERPYLIISTMPFMLKMTDPEGKSSAHEVKAGDFHWVDAKVTHSLANAGTAEGQIVEVELK